MSIDFLLSREYDRSSYHCLHFAAEAWEHLTGDSRLREVDEHQFKPDRIAALFRGMRRLSGPTVSPSIALMETLSGEDHIGVCIRRRLLHINAGGAQFLLVDALAAQYRNLRFYS